VVQANLFDDIYEKADLTIFDYLMQSKHLIITFSQFKELLAYLR